MGVPASENSLNNAFAGNWLAQPFFSFQTINEKHANDKGASLLAGNVAMPPDLPANH